MQTVALYTTFILYLHQVLIITVSYNFASDRLRDLQNARSEKEAHGWQFSIGGVVTSSTNSDHKQHCVLLAACLRGSDIVVALDSSGSIGMKNVQQTTQFLEQLINSLNVDANDTDPTVSRIGMLTYSDSATIHFQLNTFRKLTAILQAINVRYSGGTTNAADAIR